MKISPTSGSAWVSELRAQLVDQHLKCRTIHALSRQRNNSKQLQPCHLRTSLILIVAKQLSRAIWQESRRMRLREATSNSALQMWAKTSAWACRLFLNRPVLQAIWIHSKCQRPLNRRIQRMLQSLQKVSRVRAQIVNSVEPQVQSKLLLRMRLKVVKYRSKQAKWRSKRFSRSQYSSLRSQHRLRMRQVTFGLALRQQT